MMNSYELETLLRKLESTPEKIDPALLKKKTQKGAKHAVNPVYIPDSPKVSPAEYRRRHMGKSKS